MAQINRPDDFSGPWVRPPSVEHDSVVQLAFELTSRMPVGRSQNDDHAVDALQSIVEDVRRTKVEADRKNELVRLLPVDTGDESEGGELSEYVKEFSEMHSALSIFRASIARVRQENEESYTKERLHLAAWRDLEVTRQVLNRRRTLALQTGDRDLIRGFRDGVTAAFELFLRDSPLVNVQLAQQLLNSACRPLVRNDRWRRFIAAEVPELSTSREPRHRG